MNTITWAPGTNLKNDKLFEELREIQYNNKSHRLWKNYSKDAFCEAVALTICFNDAGVPEMCSSIVQRNCWPNQVYRILNRLWKHSNKILYPRVMSASFAETAKSQIQWLNDNTNFKLYFISRQTDNWEEWVIKNFKEIYGITFKTDNYKYLTCANEGDTTCWQSIIYNGDLTSLDAWRKK